MTMKRELKAGDVFMFTDGIKLVADTNGTKANFKSLKASNSGISEQVSVLKKETKPGGWKRERWVTVDVDATKKFKGAHWTVVGTMMTGGGYGHGPGDYYPDGHKVVARRVGGTEQVEFYQSGCFNIMVEPWEIILVKGPVV